jgi:hypothetical protein
VLRAKLAALCRGASLHERVRTTDARIAARGKKNFSNLHFRRAEQGY